MWLVKVTVEPFNSAGWYLCMDCGIAGVYRNVQRHDCPGGGCAVPGCGEERYNQDTDKCEKHLFVVT